MNSNKQLFNEHLNRLTKAVSLEKTDRPPIMLNASAFCLKQAGGKLSDLITDVEYGNELVLKGMLSLGDIDCTEVAGDYPPVMGATYLAFTKVPGRELGENTLWQIDERGVMSEDDYDTIINKGWNYFFDEVCKNRLGNILKEFAHFGKFAPKIIQDIIDAGIVPLSPVLTGPPFSALCGGRTIPKFMRDLHKMPEKVIAAMDAVMVDRLESIRQQIREKKPFAVFLGSSRGSGDFLTTKNFERFLWPYLKKIALTIIEEGAFVNLHLDLCWDRYIKYFLELPKGKCIFSPDSSTDILKAHEILRGHMCFTGDVSPSMLSLGNPDEVYAYCKRQADEFSPYGFIMAAGCSVPANSRPENVKAMLAAALGK